MEFDELQYQKNVNDHLKEQIEKLQLQNAKYYEIITCSMEIVNKLIKHSDCVVEDIRQDINGLNNFIKKEVLQEKEED